MKNFCSKLFFLLLLVQSVECLSADWISLGRSATSNGQGLEYSYHPDTLKMEKYPLVQVWLRQLFDRDQSTEHYSYRSAIFEIELNCTDWWTFSILDGRYYNAEERSLGRSRSAPHRKIDPNSTVDKLAKTLCNSSKQTPPVMAPERQGSEKQNPRSSGTGIFLTLEGHVLTNNHVVENCRSLKGRTATNHKINLSLLKQDELFDLAILKSDDRPPAYAKFRDQPSLALGESIVVVGFPLYGQLASDINVSTGVVSAVAGLKNDATKIQISAPVQPGNSGGPVLDMNGDLVGIVVSQLKPTAAQNVNFAIKGDLATIFLQTHGIAFSRGNSKKKLDTSQIAQRARDYTLVIECY